MNVAIDRKKFKEMLAQFKGDIGFETDLINTLIEQLPDNYVYTMVKTLYYEKCYEGNYYVVQHYLYSYDTRIFEKFDDAWKFVRENGLAAAKPSRAEALHAMHSSQPIGGFYIIKKGFDKEEV